MGIVAHESMPESMQTADDSSISPDIQATKKRKVLWAHCLSFFIRLFLSEFILSFKWKNYNIFNDFCHIQRPCELSVYAVPFANIHGILNIQADNYLRNLRCLFTEGVRLASFGCQLERHVTGLSVMELAREGFYVDENQDIKCFFCGRLYNPGQHQPVRNYHENCPLYTRRLNGNIPITQYGQNIPGLLQRRQGPVHSGVNQPLLDLVHVRYNQTSRCNVSQDREPANGDRNGQRSNPSISSSRPDFCLQSHESKLVTQCSQNEQRGYQGTAANNRPQFPEYACIQARMLSFERWPNYTAQTPCQLANAGFFFTGTRDCCRCFHCGEGLERWDAQDDPWIEHARLFPQCLYVRQMKGDEFVECFQQATDPQDESQTVTENQVGAMATVVENQACAIGNYSTAAMVKENADLLKQTLCKVCQSRDLSVVFLPCGHFVICDECAVKVDKCPVCRTKITNKQKVSN